MPTNIFADNVIQFFENEANAFLKRDRNELENLFEFNLERSKRYTAAIMAKPGMVSSADMEWENGNYREFIKIIAQLPYVPSSYQEKYETALKEIK